jgi:hypothetical protein
MLAVVQSDALDTGDIVWTKWTQELSHLDDLVGDGGTFTQRTDRLVKGHHLGLELTCRHKLVIVAVVWDGGRLAVQHGALVAGWTEADEMGPGGSGGHRGRG